MRRALHVRILYKAILRLHRGLPEELRILGDNYARDEFKRHKKCKEAEAYLFMNEWTDYAVQLGKQLSTSIKNPHTTLGSDLQPQDYENLKDEQVMQLYELMKAAKESPKS